MSREHKSSIVDFVKRAKVKKEEQECRYINDDVIQFIWFENWP